MEKERDQDELHTLASRGGTRQQLEADVEAFLDQGGKNEQVDMYVTADPPTKPVSRYGGRPI